MRGRDTFILIAAVVIGALFLTPFVHGEGLEPNDDTMTWGAYVFGQLFIGSGAFLGWFIGYFVRGGNTIGFVRYIAGNLLITLCFLIIWLLAGGGTTVIPSGILCLLGFAPLIWFGVVMARWNTVKYSGGTPPPQDTMGKGKHGAPGYDWGNAQVTTLHGVGSDLTLPVYLQRGMYRLGYTFNGGEVIGCEISLLDKGNLEKREVVAVPEGNSGAISFTIQNSGEYLFEVDGVNDMGFTLDWELTVDAI